MASDLARELRLDVLRYSRVWEDHALLEAGLRVGPEDDVLSITSGGCNALNLLLREPRSLLAVDLSPAQSALLELKIGAIRVLDHDGFLALLGERSGDRLALYRCVRPALSRAARAFWDGHTDLIAGGVAEAGRLDGYFRAFRDEHLSHLVPPAAVDALLALDDPRRQKALFRARIATPELERTFRWYFGRESMAGRGRHDAQFRYVRIADVGGYFWERFRFACEELPARRNPYLQAFLTGRQHPDHVPPCQTAAGFARLRSLVDRVTIVTAPLEEVVAGLEPGAISKANLSNVFEYVSARRSAELLVALCRALRPGGRIAYWNLLVPRSRPARLAARLHPRRDLARRLWRRDRSWFYRDFHIEERAA